MLQYEHVSEDCVCLGSVVFKFLIAIKWRALLMLTEKELDVRRLELLWLGFMLLPPALKSV